MANTYANAAVLEKIEKPGRGFSPQEEHENELAISLSNQKGNDKIYQTPRNSSNYRVLEISMSRGSTENIFGEFLEK